MRLPVEGRKKKPAAAFLGHRQKELNRDRAHIHILNNPEYYFFILPRTLISHTDFGHSLAHSLFSIITNLNAPYSSSEVVPRRPMVDGDARQWRLPGLGP